VTGKRYLIVRLAALGDVAMTSTVLTAIRERDPGAHVTWLTGVAGARLAELFPGIDRLVEVDERALLRGSITERIRAVSRLWRALARDRFDVTLLAHADERYRYLLLPLRTGQLRTLRQVASPFMVPIPGRYYGDEFVRLLDDRESYGPIVGRAELTDPRARLVSPARPDEVGVVLAPGGARNVVRESALKRWPVMRYAELARALLARGLCVTLVGDADDAWVRPSFAGLTVRDEIGTHDVQGTMAILSRADVVVVHDTGILHLARLVRTPVVALFGPTNPVHFVQPASDVRTRWGGANLACRPCYDGREFARCTNNLCMADIRTDDVVHDVLELREARLAVMRR